MEPNQTEPERAAWKIPEWCRALSISRSTLYALPPEKQPASQTIGRRRVITESPRDYLKRTEVSTDAVGS